MGNKTVSIVEACGIEHAPEPVLIAGEVYGINYNLSCILVEST